ncbi:MULTISPECIES: hypothetical protein [Halorussus]|uniref:hypothetical protein n=1 Tax=Halorussus TaxID=1070314 RepID=UPI00209EBF0F|nr:hypothetical protein [Halorussus vallis]USZ75690.1 hypothetical protein NGM07_19955 [Halorussus vallis]USZ75765.1 hypothetical protein NGM07_00190 [Halorussus vallis]
MSQTKTVTISRTGPGRYRYVCPNGHSDWDRTNNHIWCRGCRRQAENGVDVNAEHWEIHDKKTGRTIPWSAIQIE